MGFWATILIVLLSGLAGVAVFFALTHRATRRRHAKFAPIDVELALECVLDDRKYHDAWDLFLTWPIDDPYLESIRLQCCDILETAAPAKRGEDVSDDAKARIRVVLGDLRERDGRA